MTRDRSFDPTALGRSRCSALARVVIQQARGLPSFLEETVQ